MALSNLEEELHLKHDGGKASEVIQFVSVEIKPHVVRVCGREHRYGRIQVTVDKSFIGEIVDFNILVRRGKGAKIV
jgi:hypothetical protein